MDVTKSEQEKTETEAPAICDFQKTAVSPLSACGSGRLASVLLRDPGESALAAKGRQKRKGRSMDQLPTKRRGPMTWLAGRSRRHWINVAIVVIWYPLSIGPVARICQQLYLPPPKFLNVVYCPLLFLTQHSTLFAMALHAYMDWWTSFELPWW